MLRPHRFSFRDAEGELRGFKGWLDGNSSFREIDVVRELRSRPNLCLLIQSAAGVGVPDRLAWEFSIQGAFRADLVTGSSGSRHFVLVEFEGGQSNSIFKRRNANSAGLAEWSARLEHAFGQVTDWSWAKAERSSLYQTAFGAAHTSETYLVVCGRRGHFHDLISQDRLHWRCSKTQVDACKILFWTYDDLFENTEAVMSVYRDIAGQVTTG